MDQLHRALHTVSVQRAACSVHKVHSIALDTAFTRALHTVRCVRGNPHIHPRAHTHHARTPHTHTHTHPLCVTYSYFRCPSPSPPHRTYRCTTVHHCTTTRTRGGAVLSLRTTGSRSFRLGLARAVLGSRSTRMVQCLQRCCTAGSGGFWQRRKRSRRSARMQRR